MSNISSIYELVFGRICNLGRTACHQIVTRCSDGCAFLPQGCMDKHRVMGILRQMEKFLKGQEIRFTEGLRIMKSKLTNLQNSVSKLPQADQSSCKCHNTWNYFLPLKRVVWLLLQIWKGVNALRMMWTGRMCSCVIWLKLLHSSWTGVGGRNDQELLWYS